MQVHIVGSRLTVAHVDHNGITYCEDFHVASLLHVLIGGETASHHPRRLIVHLDLRFVVWDGMARRVEVVMEAQQAQAPRRPTASAYADKH
jgi:hypothetical protein